MEIYYLLLEAKPCISNEERKEADGAYINCWIKAEDEAAAKDTAVEYIAAQGWEMISMAEAAWRRAGNLGRGQAPRDRHESG